MERGTTERGAMERDHVIMNGGDNEKDPKHAKRGIIAMVLGEKEKSDAEDWKEFKKGLYMRFFFSGRLLIFFFG
jgi:hypothetical protein